MKKRYLRKSVDITLIAVEVMLAPVMMVDDFEPTFQGFTIIILWALAFVIVSKILINHSRYLEKLTSDQSEKGIKKTISQHR